MMSRKEVLGGPMEGQVKTYLSFFDDDGLWLAGSHAIVGCMAGVCLGSCCIINYVLQL